MLGLTVGQAVLFVAYIALWTPRSLIMRAAQLNGGYGWHASSAILATETVKLAVSLTLFFVYGGVVISLGSFKKIRESARMGIYFAIPGLLYAVINNADMDAGTYWVLYNIRVLFSGFFTQLFFHTSLTGRQWLGLTLLATGCIVHEYSQSFHIGSTTALLLLLLQCLLSSVSGVYNEYLFKRDVSLGMNLQNAWLYAFNIAYNLLHVVLCETALLRDGHEFFRGFASWYCLSVIVLGAGGGFATALILKHISAVMKEFGSSSVMLTTTLGSIFVLHEKTLAWNQVASVFIVATALYLYNYDRLHRVHRSHESGSDVENNTPLTHK